MTPLKDSDMKPTFSYDIEGRKGLAILAVLVIHIISSLPMQFGDYTGLLIINQLARFSVPLFVFLSGYGLSQKYFHRSITFATYFIYRLLKLLPLYVLWSVFIYVLIRIYEPWSSAAEGYSLPTALLLGKADYQLYFVPMILVLYGLFPVFKYLMSKINSIIIGSVFLGLIVLYLFVENKGWSDQTQYLIPLTWLGYFVLGMGTAIGAIRDVPALFKHKLVMRLAILAVTGWIVGSSFHLLAKGLNSIDATRFTRIPVVAYASVVSCIFIFTVSGCNYFHTGHICFYTFWAGNLT
jgi:probable poly-beta-1,6-N-acetyl-D-glucosamine export protein